jgi:NAD+ synthase
VPFTPAVFALDCAAEVERITQHLRANLAAMHKRGVVLGLSGGVDSSVCAALAVHALGPAKVQGLLMPEQDSSPDSADLGAAVAAQLGLRCTTENIAPTLTAIGCYRWRDDAIRTLFPAYDDAWKNKIVIAGGSAGKVHFFDLVVQAPDGVEQRARLPLREYLQIVAATSYKQRIRKTVEYFHADRLNYAVLGTPNRLEYDQGFFVKNGDGAADIKPIAHLYKTQVYALARHLDLPEAVCSAAPTTDTYSLPQGQDEFYFALPYAQMDLALWAHNHQRSAAELAAALGLSEPRAASIYAEIEAKRRGTRYLHLRPQLVEQVAQVSPDLST